MTLRFGMLERIQVSAHLVLDFFILSSSGVFTTHTPVGVLVINKISEFWNLVTVELQWLEHRWLVYHGYFELILKSPGKNPLAADIIIFSFFILIMVCCVYSLESPRCGDSNENTQHTFILKENRKKNIPIMPPDLAL